MLSPDVGCLGLGTGEAVMSTWPSCYLKLGLFQVHISSPGLTLFSDSTRNRQILRAQEIRFEVERMKGLSPALSTCTGRLPGWGFHKHTASLHVWILFYFLILT